MEVEEIQTQAHKFPRIGNGNGRIDPNPPDEEADDAEIRRNSNINNGGSGRGRAAAAGGGAAGRTLDFTAGAGGVGRLCGWPSSRIVRVSRASGGKDRHSKVWTSKGLRDRRVRLSVNTAIQFYDLQDRLGYDQPSKAVEWLLKAAASSISELPSINTAFPDTPKQLSDEKRSSGGTAEQGFDSADVEIEGGGGGDDPNNSAYQAQQQQQQQGGTLSKSACSSTSETSKGSGGLSLSRSESRLKARERARERAAKEKEKESETTRVVQHHQQNVNNSISQTATFTELLTSGLNGGANNVNHQNNGTSNSPNGSAGGGGGSGGGGVHEANFFHKSPRHWSTTPMDYFATGLLGPSTTRTTSHGFSGQIHLGNPLQQAFTSVTSPLFSVAGDHHQELHSFSLVPEHYVTAGGQHSSNNNGHNEYNLNFSISSSNSSGLAGCFNRGTLQSNSSTAPSLLPHIQRFSSIDGSSPSSAFFIGALPPPPNAAVATVDNHPHHHQHHFLPAGFDAGLQLCYGDGGRHSDHKGKGKS